MPAKGGKREEEKKEKQRTKKNSKEGKKRRAERKEAFKVGKRKGAYATNIEVSPLKKKKSECSFCGEAGHNICSCQGEGAKEKQAKMKEKKLTNERKKGGTKKRAAYFVLCQKIKRKRRERRERQRRNRNKLFYSKSGK